MATSSRSSHPSACVTCSILTPCKRALTRLFRIPASAALSIRAFRFRNLRKAASKMSPRRRRRPRRTFRSFRAVFWPLVPPSSSTLATSTEGETTRTVAAAVPEASVHAPSPSPETPAYVKMVSLLRSRRSGGEEKEEACRSFESCLMEMLMEEGKVRDLQDVEELLQCWERLKSPVFVELVCRFYGELCKDLFSSAGVEDGGADRDEGSGSTSAA